MAKYTASGTVSASARVAKWDVKFGGVPAGVTGPRPDGTVAYIRPAGATNAKTTAPSPNTTYRYFYVYNNSETAANITIRLLYTSPRPNNSYPSSTVTTTWPNGTPTYDSTRTTGYISGSGQSITVEAGGRAAFSLNINGVPNGDITTTITGVPSGQGATGNNDTFYLRAFANAVQVD
ncbi:MAG: hypothetical protein FWC27_13780 [Firmicutes bacterium]|nr:hypothetical protein [Bacillota bacterium]